MVRIEQLMNVIANRTCCEFVVQNKIGEIIEKNNFMMTPLTALTDVIKDPERYKVLYITVFQGCLKVTLQVDEEE